MRANYGSYFITMYMKTETTRGKETKKRKKKDKNKKFNKLYAS